MNLLATVSLLGLSVLLAGAPSAQSATFANYDKNGDGLLSRNEWAQLAEARDQKIFRKAAQGDRFITEDEFAIVISDDDLARRLSVLRDKFAAEEAADRAEHEAGETAERAEDKATEAVKAEKKSQRELKAAEKRRERQALKEKREALKEERKARKKAENTERRAAREQSVVGDG